METFRQRLTGMNTHYRYYQLETFFASLKEHNIHFAELWTGPMHFYVDSYRHDDVDILLELQAKYQIRIIGICPEQTNPKPNNIATINDQERVLRYYEQLIDVATKIGCSQITVTSGWAFLDESRVSAWKRSVAMMKKIAKLANDHHITLVMEALQPDESILVTNVVSLKEYLDEVQNEALKVCLDFGAMARAGDTIERYFEQFRDRIVHVHFVDGAPTGHLAWGDGKRDLKKDLDDLSKFHYQGYLSLETATPRYFQKPWESEQKTLDTWRKMVGGNV